MLDSKGRSLNAPGIMARLALLMEVSRLHQRARAPEKGLLQGEASGFHEVLA